MATAMKGNFEADQSYLKCIKAGVIAHLQGYAPAVSVEFARKTLNETVRPTFLELEEATGSLSPI
jgi:chemotaxis protein MotA